MKLKLLSLFLVFGSLSVFAQEENIKSKWISPIEIDGELTDWKDTLAYYYDEQDMKYSVANDSEFLYISIQIPNKIQQLKAINSGFSISVNTDLKEKDGPTVIFPIPDIAAVRAMNSKEAYEKETNRRQAGLNMVRAIFVHGFEGIVNGRISLQNKYGIKTAIKIDSADRLNYEAAISLEQLKIDKTKPFALNLRINEIVLSRYTDPGSMMGSYGYPYYGRNRYYGDPYGRRSPGRSGTVAKAVPGVWHIVELSNSN